MTKSQTIDLLRDQMPGFYSAEQVVNLIEKIEEEQVKPKLSVTQLREITQSILDTIEDEASKGNIICLEDIEFELGWDKRIDVTDAPINFDVIRDCVENSLTEAFEPLEEEDEVSSSEYIPVEDNE
jgi:hypothetical protein